jgi:hypothetical protein
MYAAGVAHETAYASLPARTLQAARHKSRTKRGQEHREKVLKREEGDRNCRRRRRASMASRNARMKPGSFASAMNCSGEIAGRVRQAMFVPAMLKRVVVTQAALRVYSVARRQHGGGWPRAVLRSAALPARAKKMFVLGARRQRPFTPQNVRYP